MHHKIQVQEVNFIQNEEDTSWEGEDRLRIREDTKFPF